MASTQQYYFSGFDGLKVKEFGGSKSLKRANARAARPISMKRPMHLVMRSALATGELSFLRAKRARRIETLVHRLGKKTGVKVYRFANSGNHLHFIVLPKSRDAFKAYIKAITGIIARITLEAERGNAKGLRFWDAKPYTRILEWGRDFRAACRYVLKNTLEALGFISYQPRVKKLKKKPDR
jgi:REP element-mobilizing transposase RayT